MRILIIWSSVLILASLPAAQAPTTSQDGPNATAAADTQAPPAGNAQNGKKIFSSDGCYECHGYAGQGGSAGARLAPRPVPFAAFSKYGGPCVVVDVGTATTYDAVTERGEFVGGAIAPGLQVAAEGLFAATARFTRVEVVQPRAVIGKSTVEALQSGLLYGTAAEIDGMVERMQKELGGDAVVVATGGLAGVVVPACNGVDHHDPFLTLEGLRLIFEKNTLRDE